MKRITCLLIWLLVESYASAQKKIIVSADGTGDFINVQAAFDAVPKNNKKPVSIFIKKGIYKEKLILDSGKSFVTLIGEDKFSTVLTYNDHTGAVSTKGDTINTYTSASFFMHASDFTAINITFQNDAGFTAGQAVAIHITGDKALFKNCRFIGNQDVLFASRPATRQYYEDCYIEGTTDFIFGPSIAWFEKCHIHSKKNSHVTAASTPKDQENGYVFNECILTADTALRNVSLGRPWRPFAKVIYIHCYIDRHIIPQGWSNWNNTENYKTTRYAEYMNYGPGAQPSMRVSWSKQFSEEEAKAITLNKIMNGWNPH